MILRGTEVDGVIFAYTLRNGRLTPGFISASGGENWLKVDYIGDFSNGLARIDVDELTGYINRKGETVIPPRYLTGGDFFEGRIFVLGENRTNILLDERGATIKEWDDTFLSTPFNEGYSRVMKFINTMETRLSGLMDRDGNLVVPYTEEMEMRSVMDIFDENDIFAGGVMRFHRTGSFGYMDADANMLIEPQYEWASRFSEGLAAVKQNGKAGFIDKHNSVVHPFEYDGARRFLNGMAPVLRGDKWGLINSGGETVLPFEYEHIKWLSEDKLMIRKDGLYGFRGKDLRTVMPCLFGTVYSFDNNILQFDFNGRKAAANPQGHCLISKQPSSDEILT